MTVCLETVVALSFCLETVVARNSSRVGAGPSKHCPVAVPVVKANLMLPEAKLIPCFGGLSKDISEVGSVAKGID